MIKLIQGDCLEKMQDIESGSVDMILTDPPYELSKSKGGGMAGVDGREYLQEIAKADLINGFNINRFLELSLSLFDKKQKFCIVVTCSNKQIAEYLNWAISKNFQYGVGVWHKSNPAPLCNYKYLNDAEYWIYIKGNKSKILGSYGSKSMVYKSKINKVDKKRFNHPTCKPVEFLSKFIINHTSEAQTVLDPFMGSGSTGIACLNTNRNFIGIELDSDYFDIASKRIDLHQRDNYI